jgi:hypothetical protein
MICPDCHGRGFRQVAPIKLPMQIFCLAMFQSALVLLPCESCGGTGRAHCCDGLQEQPFCPLTE